VETNELENPDGPSGPEFVLRITVAPRSRAELADEFRRIKPALVDWEKRRGPQGVVVVFTVVGPPEIHEAFDEVLAKVYTREPKLGPILQRRMLQVVDLDVDGTERSQYEMPPRAEGSQSQF